ncbi:MULTISPECIES: LPS-assembly protein LptD [unclassified Marinobacter]|uniref:LPS-assembly protein LptD n=1 Tax=unclassified Marinobacter TaxID=83889 RepID=UPI00192730CD|nr:MULTISPECIES: LPS assembly protein LptD [unclassified Marinobacter]MBL3823145.1 LPS assembly protein LptD [Marinobacter sp. MC3]MBL3892524.1 LPS assembly protein LptD [Marinobacter sp. MW3]
MLLAALLGLGGAASYAQTAPSAAEIDWRPRAELPAEVRSSLPLFCDGGYLPSGRSNGVGGAFANGADAEQPLEASGLNARYEIDRELFLQGDVRIRQGGFQVTGSEARYSQQQGAVSVQGPLVSRGDGFLLTGENANYDVDTGRLDINTATFLLHGPEMRGRAGSLARISEEQVVIEDGFLTTCGPKQNDWAIVASDIQLDRAEGFGTAKHVRLEVLDVPVFYWPWASFPIDDRRKSGFLYPQFGSSSAGSGGFLAVPYYFNLAPHYDATLTPQYIHGRGLFNEIEGRYLSSLGETTLQLGYIGNDSAFQEENPGESGERWALDATTRAAFGRGWRGYGDFSVVSDEDYLSDLNRSLEINQATHLQRKGGVAYRSDKQYFDAYLNDYQTISDRIADVDKPYAQLPEVIYAGETGAGIVEANLESQYTVFYRDNEALTGLDRANGQRFRARPELALPMRALWGFSRPSVSLDYTRYDLDDYVLGDGTFDRTVPVAEWDNGLYFDRQSSLFDVPYNQTLEPRLYYAWADADPDQNDIPDFDTDLQTFRFEQLFRPDRFTGGDRVGDANQLTVALTSRFNDLLTGAERARFSIGQVQYFEDREVTLFGEGAGTRSRSPLAGEVVLNPLDTLEIRSSGLWDPDTGDTEEGRSQLTFHSSDYRYLASVGHTYSRGELEQSDIAAVFPVSDRVSLIGRWVYDSNLDRTVGSLAGLEYNNCCWSVQVVHQNYLTDDRELDSRILFQIQLKGLGGSDGASSSISEAIYGFDERERRRFGTP